MSTSAIGIQDLEESHETWAPNSTAVGRVVAFAYGAIAYTAFLVAFLYAIGFVGNLLVPKGIDDGVAGPIGMALLINTLLLSAFVIQHTIMARPAFKRWFTQYVPRTIERSTFVLLASSILLVTFWQWRPIPTIVWEVTHPAAFWGLTAVQLAGWGIVLIASFMVSHFDLFGLRQVWLNLLNRRYEPVGFRLVGLYKLVRHPLMLGFLIAFWVTPVMTVGHLFFAIMTTVYIFMGTWFEERDLVAQHGEDYLSYRRKVRGLVPVPKRAH